MIPYAHGLLGEVGQIMRIKAEKLIVATYCEPCTGRLWMRVPLACFPGEAANDHAYGLDPFKPNPQTPR